jgi:hypothetical protein
VAFTIPDQGEGDSDIQSIFFQEDIDIILAGQSGIDCVLSGGAITGGADMTPAVAKCGVLSNRTLFAVAAADVTISAADATNPRLDLIVVNSSGALAVRTGTAAAAPRPPVRTANDVVLGMVYVPANDTAIATTQIIDKRVTPSFPQVIYNQTAQRSQNNSTSAVSLFSNGSGLTIPDGLFLSGRRLRVRTGGNILHNSTTAMTITVIISYGGTNIFQDVTASYGTTADADRMAWTLDFELIAQGNAAQVMHGKWFNAGATVTAPTTGIGDIATDEHLGHTSIGSATGGIAVDSDAGNRVLNITFTMSTASASHEWVCQGLSVELM